MPQTEQAFTRLELLAVVSALALLAACSLPLFAATRADSDRAACFSNLREFSIAMSLWGNDHDDLPPWIVPQSEGGTWIGQKTALVWVEFMTFSNEISSPRIFACPADPTVKVPSNWGSAANGLANTGFRNNAVSYFLSYHSRPFLPRSVITGDRDFNPSSWPPVACAYGPNNAASIQAFAGATVSWTNAVHRAGGHLLATDGSVEFTPSSSLASRIAGAESQSDNGNVHLIYPR